MKIAIVSDRYYPSMDGIVRFLEAVIPGLEKRMELQLLVPGYSKSQKSISAKTTVVPAFKAEFLGLPYMVIPKKIKYLKEAIKNSDKVWVQTMGLFGMAAFYYARKYKKPVYVFVHSIEWELLLHSLKAPRIVKLILARIIKCVILHFYKKAELLMVPSKDMQHLFPTMKTGVIPLGVDRNIFRPLAGKSHGFTVGYCGRLSEDKNLMVLKQAFKMLHEKVPNSSLLLVGDGPLKEKLKGIGITITGFVYDVVGYLNKMDVFVLPSLTETTSLATLEAMVCGLPVIVTKSSPVLRRIIQDGKNGFFFHKLNANELEERLMLLYSKPKLRKSMGRLNQKIIAKRFSWSTAIERIAGILNKI